MPYRELTMIDVRELLRRWQAGHSDREVARGSGADRKTVARYTALAAELSLPKDRELTDDEVHEVAQSVQARRVPDPSRERAEVAQHRDRIEAWLSQTRPLRLSKIHVLLVRDFGLRASYATLRRYVRSELGWRKKQSTVRVEDTPPGQVAQIDFGEMGRMLDPDTGRIRRLWVLIVTLVYSRYQFVWPTFEQTTEAVCLGLDAAWQFFGAMAHVIVPDNMKAIVKRPDALEAELCDAFLDYSQARRLLVDPARVRSPQDKARVENQVPYVRESWFDGESFTGLADCRESARTWCREVAGTRLHGTTRRVPRDVFEAEERSAMKPAPTEPFDVPIWADCKVHLDHHVQVARALYSVPTRFVGKTVRVRADRTSVRIYHGTELAKVHRRVLAGQRVTDPNDYPQGKAEVATRSVAFFIARAQARGTHVGVYAERVLSGPLPWARIRRVQELLRLCDKYGDGRVEAVCQSALAFDVVDVHRIARMLKSAIAAGAPEAADRKVVRLEVPRFARDPQHFSTRRRADHTGEDQ